MPWYHHRDNLGLETLDILSVTTPRTATNQNLVVRSWQVFYFGKKWFLICGVNK
jgi:hypothetical protein